MIPEYILCADYHAPLQKNHLRLSVVVSIWWIRKWQRQNLSTNQLNVDSTPFYTMALCPPSSSPISASFPWWPHLSPTLHSLLDPYPSSTFPSCTNQHGVPSPPADICRSLKTLGTFSFLSQLHGCKKIDTLIYIFKAKNCYSVLRWMKETQSWLQLHLLRTCLFLLLLVFFFVLRIAFHSPSSHWE